MDVHVLSSNCYYRDIKQYVAPFLFWFFLAMESAIAIRVVLRNKSTQVLHEFRYDLSRSLASRAALSWHEMYRGKKCNGDQFSGSKDKRYI